MRVSPIANVHGGSRRWVPEWSGTVGSLSPSARSPDEPNKSLDGTMGNGVQIRSRRHGGIRGSPSSPEVLRLMEQLLRECDGPRERFGSARCPAAQGATRALTWVDDQIRSTTHADAGRYSGLAHCEEEGKGKKPKTHGEHTSESHPARHGLQIDAVLLESGDGEQYGRDHKERNDDKVRFRRVAF